MNTETNNPSSGNELTKEVASLFESLKHVNEDGVEYWSARELYPHLGYARWQRFEEIIEKAKEACKSVSQRIEDHFTDVGKIVKAGVATKPGPFCRWLFRRIRIFQFRPAKECLS